MDRRDLLKNSLALGGLAGLGGCAAPPRATPTKLASSVPIEDRPPPLAPIRAHPDRLFDIKVCIRPFRTKGPNLDVEQIGDAMVVHNYGHGGSGWSLSWGSADMAVQKAMSTSPKQIAVIGCGIIGLTSAITAQRAGAQVTIYTRELLPRTRSVRANGSWTPDSRISLAAEAPANFGATWEQMARMSWKTLRSYLGLPGNPVTFTDHYRLSDLPPGQPTPRDPAIPPLPPPSWTGLPTKSSDFGEYADRIGDITPKTQILTDDINPFPVKYASRTTQMFFNFTEYGHLLTSDFFAAGGKIVMRDFHEPGELASLPEKVIINCPGYAAHDWWKDKAMVPVRGQTGWLIPQPEVNYAMTYRNVQILSKSDGIMVIALEDGDMKGYNNSDESVRRAESERAVRVIEDLFALQPDMIKMRGSFMRHKLLLIAVACAAASSARAGTWDGVYTDAQAERGGVLFQQQCARCHGANLAGTFETPPLVGRFKPYWSGATLDVLFDYVATAMPLDRPGSLSRTANADIVAFILKANNFPAGAKELSDSSGDLKAIRFDAVRPPPETAAKPSRKKSAGPR